MRRILVAAFAVAFAAGAGAGLLQRSSSGDEPDAAAVAAELALYAPDALPAASSADTAIALPAVAAGPAPAATRVAAVGAVAPAAPAALAAPAGRVIEGSLGRGQTLAEALSRQGLSADRIFEVVREMSTVFNFRYSMPGDRYRLALSPAGNVESFHYERSPSERYEVKREGSGYATTHHEPTIVRRQARLAGVVTTSLADAIEQLGESRSLALDFAEIFAWDVDFTRGVHRGDEFSIVYERLFTVDAQGHETYARPGQILAARYSSDDQDYSAVYFEPSKGHGAYYRPDGSPVERQFLKAPVNFSHISSTFTQARLHPILKIWRPHLGIDYAAAYGTPVWSVANGEVVFKGYQGGYGNLVKVRHANGYVSYYAHLSRFAPGLRVGQRVSQKQVIGAVGSSGLSTGPHVCFRLTKEGEFVNPATLHARDGESVPRGLQKSFKERSSQLMAALDPRPLVVTNEAL